jgi:hypothetical protein
MIKKFTDSTVALENAEPIFSSLFELVIIPHISLATLPIEILKDDVKSLSGFDKFEAVPDTVYQTFGAGTRRAFAGIQVDNVIELNVTVNLNLRGEDGIDATNFITLKKMKDLQFNRATGVRGLKVNSAFQVIVSRTTKDDKIWCVLTMQNCIFGPSGVTGLDEVNIESDDIATLSFTLISDKNKAEIMKHLVL